ncbi:MAG: shikimate kinase [Clostridiales bacterium]|nr:shikimate kinase [Clostridiales bacterium]
MNNIVLCGFMGCGKSTVGRNIARKSNRKFIDMDAYIESKAGMTVSQIFEKYGEDGFRDMEHEACIELSEMSGLVIASGGGAFTFERNCEVFKGKDTVIFLDVPLSVIKKRLRYDKSRPLLQRPDKDKAMKELYDKRLPLYRKAADITVKGQNSPLKTAYAVIESAEKNQKGEK